MDPYQFNANYKFWSVISVLIALTGIGCLAISASHFLPPAIHMMSALLVFKVWDLVTVAITTLASHLEIQPLTFSSLIYHPGQEFNRASSSFVPSQLEGESGHCGAPPPLALSSSPIISAWVGKRPLWSAPLFHQTLSSPSTGAPSILSTSRVGPPRWIHKWCRSKVISPSSCSPPVAAMERSKVIYLIQVCWRGLGSLQ